MKKLLVAVVAAVMVLGITVSSQAGWFSKIKPLKPAMGYVESKEEVEAVWDECIERYKEGVQKGWDYGNITTTGNLYCIGSSSSGTEITGELRVGDTYFNHECPDCNKKHVSDYPETETVVTGKQYKITTKIYKDGKLVTELVEYTYPHQKIEKKTTKKIKYESEVETTITTPKEAK